MKYSLILIDRDGVINKKLPKHNYVTSIKKFKFLPDVKKAISLLKKSGLKSAIISNQSAIGKGLMTIEDLNKIHNYMINEFKRYDGKIEKIFFCPHKKEDNCSCRKPQPGMILQALDYFNIKKDKAVFLGDFYKDYLAAKKAEIDFIFINEDSDEADINRKKFSKVNPLSFSSLYDAILFLTSN